MSKGKIAAYVIALAAIVLAPEVLSPYNLSLLGRFMGLAVMGIGISLIWGYAGILSLGQGVFFGLGAYALAMHLKLVATSGLPDFMVWNAIRKLPWWWVPFHNAWFAMAAVILVPGVFGALLGWLFFRRRLSGVYVALMTQALVLAFSTLLVSQQGTTGGFNGLTDFKTLLGFGLNQSGTRLALYWATAAILIVGYGLAQMLVRSHVGKVLIAVRDGENRTRFLGYDPAIYKTFIFAVAAIYAGVSGALFTLHVGVISPAMIDVVPSIEFVIGVAIGGREVLAGAVLGTVFLNIAKDRISSAFPEAWLYVIGLSFIGVVLFMPGGVAKWLESIGQGKQFRHTRFLHWTKRFTLQNKKEVVDGETASRA